LQKLIVAMFTLMVGMLLFGCGSSGPTAQVILLEEKVAALESALAENQAKVAQLVACGSATTHEEFCDVDGIQAKNIMAAHAELDTLGKATRKLLEVAKTNTDRVTNITKGLEGVTELASKLEKLDDRIGAEESMSDAICEEFPFYFLDLLEPNCDNR
jgi:hypothetical protein